MAADTATAGTGPAPRTRTRPLPRTSRSARRHTPGRPRRSVLLTVLTSIVVLYSLVPLAWLVINACKTQPKLLDSFGLWFSGRFALWDNIRETLTYNDHIFVRWLLNTLLYVVLGAAARRSWRCSAATGWRSSTSPAGGRSSPW